MIHEHSLVLSPVSGIAQIAETPATSWVWANILFGLAYDGAHWHQGFQEQHAGSLGECTVEAAVMQALTALDLPGLLPHSAAMPLQRQVCWGRAARTDARVSAACNVASLCLPLPCNPGTQPRAVSCWLRRLQASLNCRLPPSLRLLTVELLPGALRTRPLPPAADQPACTHPNTHPHTARDSPGGQAVSWLHGGPPHPHGRHPTPPEAGLHTLGYLSPKVTLARAGVTLLQAEVTPGPGWEVGETVQACPPAAITRQLRECWDQR
ncbi:hypothetical protein V8C86DRAFT_856001 [Haematococcus lacustris]